MDLSLIMVCSILHVPLISPGTWLYVCTWPITTSTQLPLPLTASWCAGTEPCSEFSMPDCQPAAAGIEGIQHLTASDSKQGRKYQL